MAIIPDLAAGGIAYRLIEGETGEHLL